MDCKDVVNKDVFISYASSDSSAAKLVCNKLEESGLRCWIAHRDVSTSDDWPTSIVNGLKASKIVVLIFSSSANNSRHVMRELAIAVDRGRPIIPLRIENVSPTGALEYFLSVIQWIDAAQSPLEKHLVDLHNEVLAILETESRWVPPSAVISLRLFVESLSVVSALTWEKVELVEEVYALSDFQGQRPEHTEIMEKELEILLNCADKDNVSLDADWKEEYWKTGYVHAISSDKKPAVLAFFQKADDQLLRLIDVFRTPTNFTREGLRRKGIAGSFDHEATEQLIEKCVQAGLLSEGMPGGQPGSLSYFRDMKYKKKPLLYDLGRLLDMSGIHIQKD